MLTKCPVCKNKWDKKYTTKETGYIFNECSSKCLLDTFNTLGLFDPEHTRGLVLKPFQDSIRSFRSNYERKFEAWLRVNHIEYLYEPWIITFKTGIQYVPDFYLPYSKIFIEIKGLWETGAWKKFLSLVEIHPSTFLINDFYLRKIIREGLRNIYLRLW